MARPSVCNLPMPPDGYRIDKVTRRADGVITFETKSFCREEDEKRSRLLLLAARKYPGVIDAGKASDLARRLAGSADGTTAPETLASSVYMGGRRVRLVGWLWATLEGDLP